MEALYLMDLLPTVSEATDRISSDLYIKVQGGTARKPTLFTTYRIHNTPNSTDFSLPPNKETTHLLTTRQLEIKKVLPDSRIERTGE